jgi:hypothetical protein
VEPRCCQSRVIDLPAARDQRFFDHPPKSDTRMTGTELIALGHSVMAGAHKLILLGGLLGLSSILAGLISRRVGAPMLLVFLGLGMLAGDDHGLGIPFNDFTSAYLIGSVALAVILFEGGLKTPVSMLRLAFWPAALLATIGVAMTAIVLGVFVSLVDGVPLVGALLAGAAAAPTDAAAVAVLLRRAGAALPERLLALLEIESGLNDPMSVFLVLLLLHLIAEPGSIGFGDAALLFLQEMAGGAVLGLVGGWALAQSLKRLRLEASLAPVLLLAGGLAVFCSAPRHQRLPRNLPRRRGDRRRAASLAARGRALLRGERQDNAHLVVLRLRRPREAARLLRQLRMPPAPRSRAP